MSKVTEQLDRIEAKITAESTKDRLRGLGDTAIAEVIKDKLEEISEKLDCAFDGDNDLVCEFNGLDELADIQREYINFLEDRLIELCDKWERLYKKNKRLKKKVKRLSAYIDEIEVQS